MSASSLAAVRAEALFVSNVRYSDQITPELVRSAVMESLRRFGAEGCLAVVAQEFGEHPETAAPRMMWVLTLLRTVYPASYPVGRPSSPNDPPPSPVPPEPACPSPDPLAA